jgi:Kef-type K+ transport system membrane component KefB
MPLTLGALAAGAGHAGPVPPVLLLLVLVLLGAKLAGELAERLGQPAVLGELLAGIVLGNMILFGGPDLTPLAQAEAFEVLAEIGAILLLFHVGLESTPREMMAVGGRATWVAIVGIVAPMILGVGVGRLLLPHESVMVHVFLGAMLAATSVGITARVLKDARVLHTGGARIILGAAVVDDVLGLVVLAVVAGLITAMETGVAMSAAAVLMILVKALGFLVAALVVGAFLSPRLFKAALRFRSHGLVLTLSLSFCFALAYLAQQAGLAAIVGAFAAGLVLEDVHFEGLTERGERPLHETLEPLLILFVPAFFVRMGMLVDLRAFGSLPVLGLALALTVAAIVGKLACGLAAPPTVSRLMVALGMMPRGEVGLIFAGIGATLMLGGKPVVDSQTYAAAVFMVMATTMVAPPLLARVAAREQASS